MIISFHLIIGFPFFHFLVIKNALLITNLLKKVYTNKKDENIDLIKKEVKRSILKI
jgi:hypothetical protein